VSNPLSVSTPERRKIDRAADNLDRVAEYMVGLAAELRSENDIYSAYAKVYYLKRELYYIVTTLGHGTPLRTRTKVRPVKIVRL